MTNVNMSLRERRLGVSEENESERERREKRIARFFLNGSRRGRRVDDSIRQVAFLLDDNNIDWVFGFVELAINEVLVFCC